MVLKYWIENQFHDFDNSLIEKLKIFINQTIQNGIDFLSIIFYF